MCVGGFNRNVYIYDKKGKTKHKHEGNRGLGGSVCVGGVVGGV